MENQLVRRIAKLVELNKDLSQELRIFQDRYNELLHKNEAYEQIVQKYISLTEIKKKGIGEKAQSMKIGMATVLYANIHGFRNIIPGASVEENTQTFIDQLDNLYVQFDEIIASYPLVKIKTIGDSYMCVGGIPKKNITNPIEVVLAAFKMTQVDAFPGESLSVRVAVHTGPLTAYTIGKVKTAYDIKGDTVNIASRMEASGLNGKVLISIMTYELAKEFFECEYYGKLPVKYKGSLDIYAVKGIKPELSVDGLGKEPNAHFDTKLALIQFHDLQEIVLDLLEEKLPKGLFYHNLKHTVDVVTEVELIGWAEGVSDEDQVLLKTSALFHDVGHIISYDDHEYHSTLLARQLLPRFNYTKEQIEQICQIIMATKMPPEPKNILEKIICDADLDYLGRMDFIPVSITLYEELKMRNKIRSLNEWYKMQLTFISNHQYFTQTAGKLREVNKQMQINRIKQMIL